MPSRVLDPQFDNVGKSDSTVIWRIDTDNILHKDPSLVSKTANGSEDGDTLSNDLLRETKKVKMKLSAVPSKEYGVFYEGDSYLLLRTYGTPATSWNIHMWIGKDSSPDEHCTCAYKSLELEELLDRKAIQYSETQNHESKQFLSYFKGGIRYMVGGISGGLKHVSREENGERRLFHVKGKFNCRVQQVPVDVKSLNKGDAFILVNKSSIFVWNGPKCNAGERIKAAEVARSLRDERGGKLSITLIDDDWSTNQQFYTLLGTSPGVNINESVEDDIEFERHFDEKIKLFRVSDAKGAIAVDEVKPPLNKDSLDTNDCFFLDMCSAGIYVWVGNACTDEERRSVWIQAKSYLVERHLPLHTPLVKVNEGGEPAIMKIALNWPPDHPFKNEYMDGLGVAKINEEDHRVDVKSMLELRRKEQTKMFDDGSGEVKVWRVVRFELDELPVAQHGIFFSGDSYVISYHSATFSQRIIYFWLGMMSTLDERGAAAMMAAHINRQQFAGHAIEVRLTQSKESAHFLAIFGGFIVTLFGGKASGFRDTKHNDDIGGSLQSERLFQVHNNRVSQVEARAKSLNSGDVFLLKTPNGWYRWIGKGSTEDEHKIAAKCIEKLMIKDCVEMKEGSETDSFWDALGGKSSYATGGTFDVPTEYTARLFHCSNAPGYFHVEEICDFSQSDLEPDDVMLLDTFNEIFVWIGSGSNVTEQKEVLKLAVEYVKQDPCRKDLDDAVMLTIKQGFEPFIFTAHFPSWDANYWKNMPSYEQIKSSLEEHSNGYENATTVQEAMEEFQKTYEVDVLRSKDLPHGVDPCKKEDHLSDEDFERVFGYRREKFNALKPWKRNDEKRRVGLF